jgi:predicted GH43/DUF377 family glycosyl hydrolase
MKQAILTVTILFGMMSFPCFGQAKNKSKKTVPESTMQKVYNEIKTPYKYGIVLPQPDSTRMVDSPTVFRQGNTWYMTYIIFDGRGYETWIAESKDLLHWDTKGKILSFSENRWDKNQIAGYFGLVDINWGGSCKAEKYQDKNWMTYIGGAESGYEAGKLSIGLAYTTTPTKAKEWNKLPEPILRPDDPDARWFEKGTLFKSTIIHDKTETTGYPFVMYYNANGGEKASFESIGMAVSKDMLHWERKGTDPVITKRSGICGDAQIVKIDDVYVMFYFGAFWKPGAFERFACSYDLVNWTDWKGEDLVAPSVDYDKEYAHKPWVVKWKGVVYHYYCATGSKGRTIAVATSKDLK